MGEGGSHALVRIGPNAEVVPVGRIPRGGCLAFAGEDIYLGGATRLRRLSGAAKLGAGRKTP